MKHYRISASFLNAFLNGQEVRPGERFSDFEKAVLRIPMKPNMFFEFGKWFEDYICQIHQTGNLEKPGIPNYPDNTPDVNYDEIEKYMLDSIGGLEVSIAKKFADELGPGTWQDHISKEIIVKSMDEEPVKFTLHGFTDFLPEMPNLIVDLKTTRVGKAEKLDSKYEKSIQHGLYCWIKDRTNFKYMTYSTWLRRYVNKLYSQNNNEFQETLGLILINLLNTLKRKGLKNEFEANFSVDSERLRGNS